MESAQYAVILSQYRHNSGYKDIVGDQYHFPKRYLSALRSPPVRFIYYEPRNGGEQVYFGTGIVVHVSEDDEEPDHYYADVVSYRPFPKPIGYYDGPDGRPWEDAKTMRNSVRKISTEQFTKLLERAGVSAPLIEELPSWRGDPYAEKLKSELRRTTDLKRIQRVIEAYERPSSITRMVKRERGYRCQLCGQLGFLKADGTRYCEVHHLFHLSRNPPINALEPEYVVVVCATCHRRMHFARVSEPRATARGWEMTIDDEIVKFPVDWSRLRPPATLDDRHANAPDAAASSPRTFAAAQDDP